jgi:hypothetical protein
MEICDRIGRREVLRRLYPTRCRCPSSEPTAVAFPAMSALDVTLVLSGRMRSKASSARTHGRINPHRGSADCQLRTTFSVEGSAPAMMLLIRKRWPSAVTSQYQLFTDAPPPNIPV